MIKFYFEYIWGNNEGIIKLYGRHTLLFFFLSAETSLFLLLFFFSFDLSLFILWHFFRFCWTCDFHWPTEIESSATKTVRNLFNLSNIFISLSFFFLVLHFVLCFLFFFSSNQEYFYSYTINVFKCDLLLLLLWLQFWLQNDKQSSVLA